MDSDLKLEQRVLDELEREPEIDASHIRVKVNGGVVSLTGLVDSRAQKRRAEEAVRRAPGVHGIAEGLEVRVAGERHRLDLAVATDVLGALEQDDRVPHESVTVTVENGVATLDGDVEWRYQKAAADEVASLVPGVSRVINHILITPRASERNVKGDIETALARSDTLDPSGIYVDIVGRRVVLRGTVDSWREREEAERIAWATYGVAAVENLLAVRVEAARPAHSVA